MIRLFLSVDVAGSTLYKTTTADRTDGGWLAVFRQFFSNFPIVLTGQVAFEFAEEEMLPDVSVWKFMGDEAIFIATPTRAEEVTLLVRAHFAAMATYEAEFLSELPLRLKGTAWLASFPEPNIEIEVPELGGSTGATQTDFIGPDIDLGFRVTKFSTPSTIAVSLDLMEAVLDADNGDQLNFFMLGREPLKGVHFGRPYPIIWARPAATLHAFMPWDVEDNPLVARALAQGPTPRDALKGVVDSSRAFLRKMHGVKASPISFGAA